MFGAAQPTATAEPGEELVQGELGWAEEYYKNAPLVDSKPLTQLEKVHRYCTQGDADAVEELLQTDKSLLNTTGMLNNTGLHFAAMAGQVECVDVLLKAGASINAVNDNGDTALHQAAWKNHVEVVKTLTAHDANRDLTNKAGKTAPQMARTEEMKTALPEVDAKQAAGMVVMAKDDDDDDDDDW